MAVREVEIRHVTLSVQDDKGRPITSKGVELQTGYYSDTSCGYWYAIDKHNDQAQGRNRHDAICNWLALFAA